MRGKPFRENYKCLLGNKNELIQQTQTMWPLTEPAFPEPTGKQRLHVEQLGVIHLHLAGGLIQNPHKVSG